MHGRRTTSPRFALRFAGGVFVLVGIIFVAVTPLISMGADKRTATAEATIVDVEERTSTDSDGDRSTSYYPVLQFEDSDHVTHTGTQNVSSGGYDVGDVVEVQYDPMDPEGNLIMTRDVGTLHLLETIFKIGGGFFIFLGIALYVGSLFARAY